MKKILFRKLLFECLKFFFLSTISLSTIVWVFQAVNYLDIMVEDGRNYFVYLKYTIYSSKSIGKICHCYSFFYFFLNMKTIITYLVDTWNDKIQVVNFLKISFFIVLFQIFLLSVIIPKTQDLGHTKF